MSIYEIASIAAGFAGFAMIFLAGFYGEQSRILELELAVLDGSAF